MKPEALSELFDEVRLLFHRLAMAAEELHRDESVTIGMRGVLELLCRQGPAPVPQMARDRSVSRQHVQTLVNGLLAQRLVVTQPNPAHRRSSLVALTPLGDRTIRRMLAREQRFLDQRGIGVDARQAARAASTLRTARRALENMT